jgi:hypothetical protein
MANMAGELRRFRKDVAAALERARRLRTAATLFEPAPAGPAFAEEMMQVWRGRQGQRQGVTVSVILE